MVHTMGEGLVGEERLDAGDLESLFRAHYVGLVRLAVLFGMDQGSAEEVAQDAFLRYRPGRAAVGSELAYLRRSVINLAKGRHRKAGVVRRHQLAAVPDVPAAESQAADRARDRAIVEAVQGLPERQRACVLLHYFEGLTDREVGDVLGVSTGSVKTHLHRARVALRHALEEER
jgi:RNA polymerase sigma factor (sigma-70 family)